MNHQRGKAFPFHDLIENYVMIFLEVARMLHKKLLLIALILFPQWALASNYFGFGYGASAYKSETLSNYDVSPTGSIYGAYFGFRQQIIGLEGFLYKSNTNGDINHNSSEYTLNT